jgi:hypothetical protein
MNTPTPREEFEEWLETFYDNSNILSPRSLAWEAWQAAQKELTAVTEQRDRLAEALRSIVNLYENPDKGCIPDSYEMYDSALQSLTPDQP